MKRALLLAVAWLTSSASASLADTKTDKAYLALLHRLQYVESYEEVKKLIPNCPPLTPDAGEDNAEVIVKTKLFGFDAEGEFNFHKNVLVSHGFRIKTPTHKDAHDLFLEVVTLLDKREGRLHAETTIGRIGFDGEMGAMGQPMKSESTSMESTKVRDSKSP